MLEQDLVRAVEGTVRGIATAAKTLRLYPVTSPIPMQAVEAACGPLNTYLTSEGTLVLNVTRDGFACMGTPLSTSIAGAADLADMLRSHGVAEVVFTSGADVGDLLAFLGVIMRAPEELLAEGGVVDALTAANVREIRVVTVSLAVASEAEAIEDVDVDDFFRELASDPAKLAVWLAAATKGDEQTLADGIGELAGAAGPENMSGFMDAFAEAFKAQDGDGKDILLGLGLEPGRTRDLMGDMFGRLGDSDISEPLGKGLYGKNMLSLSTALTRLPLGQRMEDIIAEVRASLPTLGKDQREVEFLDHMIEVRNDPSPETPLVVLDPTYAEIAEASRVDEGQRAAARAEVVESAKRVNARSVGTMLALLDQQKDFGLYVRGLDNLAVMVPRLLDEGDLELASTVLQEIAERDGRTSQPWPELGTRLRAALKAATPPQALGSLLDAVIADRSLTDRARDILRLTDDAAHLAFTDQAIRRGDTGLDAAESLVGRRLIDLLAAAVPQTQWGHLGPVVRRLAAEGGPNSMRTLEGLLRRPDEQSRTEVAGALAGTANPGAARHLVTLLNDPSPKVVSVAARSLAKTRLPGTAEALGERLETLDIDGKDFALSRELIGCLAQMPEPAARAALQRLADRKALIKRGHFLEVQQLAREALDVQARKGAAG